MKMLFSPSSHNGLFIINIIIIIIILFLTARQGGSTSPRPAGPSGLPSATLRREARAVQSRAPPLPLGLTHGLVNGRTAACKFMGRRAPFQPEAISRPPATSRGSNCISEGPSAVPRTCIRPCGSCAGGLQGRTSLESSSRVSKAKPPKSYFSCSHDSRSIQEPRDPKWLLGSIKKEPQQSSPNAALKAQSMRISEQPQLSNMGPCCFLFFPGGLVYIYCSL